MTFASDIRQWKTIEEFAKHLSLHDPAICNWVNGAIVHHTYRPLQSQWRGKATMEGLKQFYIDKGWTAGPHLFLAENSPNPEDNGIWQLTPLNIPGIHANACNPTTWGIEVVGDYDAQPWDDNTKRLTVGSIGELFKWRVLTVNNKSIRPHKECNPTKSCPGNAINMNDVRSWITAYMAQIPVTNVVNPQSSILSNARCTQNQASKYILNRAPKPIYTSGDINISILPVYWNLCNLVNVDFSIAIAQMIHETGNLSSWWCNRPRRNPAGIGVTGESRTDAPPPEDVNKWAWNDTNMRWQKGVLFNNWNASAIAHIGRLVAYATKPSERNEHQSKLVSQALSYRTLPIELHGSAPTLEGLNGKWAYPGTMYAQKISEIANQIITISN